jgi:predicted secreted protein
MATVINGKNFLVYVNGEAIAASKSCKLTLSHDVRDTFTKDDSGWKTNAEGAKSWNVSVDGLVAFDASGYTLDDLTNLVINRTQVHVKFMTGTSGNKYWHGQGYIKSVDIDASNEESTSFSASFEGTAALTQAMHT